jgi:hypothetical protein
MMMERNGFYNFWLGMMIVTGVSLLVCLLAGSGSGQVAVGLQGVRQLSVEQVIYAKLARDTAALLVTFFCYWFFVACVGFSVCHVSAWLKDRRDREYLRRVSARMDVKSSGGLDVTLRG